MATEQKDECSQARNITTHVGSIKERANDLGIVQADAGDVADVDVVDL